MHIPKPKFATVSVFALAAAASADTLCYTSPSPAGFFQWNVPARWSVQSGGSVGAAVNRLPTTGDDVNVWGGGLAKPEQALCISSGVAAGAEPSTFPPYVPVGPETGVRGAATGFFHVEIIDGRDWMVDPVGRGVYLAGVDWCMPQGMFCEALGYAPNSPASAARPTSATRGLSATSSTTNCAGGA